MGKYVFVYYAKDDANAGDSEAWGNWFGQLGSNPRKEMLHFCVSGAQRDQLKSECMAEREVAFRKNYSVLTSVCDALSPFG